MAVSGQRSTDICQKQDFRINRIMLAIRSGIVSVGPQNDVLIYELD